MFQSPRVFTCNSHFVSNFVRTPVAWLVFNNYTTFLCLILGSFLSFFFHSIKAPFEPGTIFYWSTSHF